MKGIIVVALALSAYGVSAHADEANGVVERSKVPKGAAAAPVGPIKTGGPWSEFSFGTAGTFAKGCAPADPAGAGCTPSSSGNSHFVGAPPWTFTAPSDGVSLTVTDAFNRGDTFEIYDNGHLVGSTSAVPSNPTSCGSDPVPCSVDPTVSHAVIDLPGGPHSITIKAATSPYQAGAAYFRLEAKREHFVCYRIKGESRPHAVTTDDQFGTLRLEVLQPELLCVPASKTVLK